MIAYRAFRPGHGRLLGVVAGVGVTGAALSGRGVITHRRSIILAQQVPLALLTLVVAVEAALTGFVVLILTFAPEPAIRALLLPTVLTALTTIVRNAPQTRILQ